MLIAYALAQVHIAIYAHNKVRRAARQLATAMQAIYDACGQCDIPPKLVVTMMVFKAMYARTFHNLHFSLTEYRLVVKKANQVSNAIPDLVRAARNKDTQALWDIADRLA